MTLHIWDLPRPPRIPFQSLPEVLMVSEPPAGPFDAFFHSVFIPLVSDSNNSESPDHLCQQSGSLVGSI